MPTNAPSGPRTPTFTFRNIGPIQEAELELGDLTVIAGQNNTGKTYLVYTLYGFLKTWRDWLQPALVPARPHPSPPSSRWAARYPTFEQISEQVAETGQTEFPLDPRALSRERKNATTDLTRQFSKRGLPAVFSSPPEKFERASIGMKLTVDSPWGPEASDALLESEDSPLIRYDGINLSVIDEQPGNKRRHPVALRRRLWRRYLPLLLPELPSDPFVLSAERFGISLFYRELDLKKSQIVDLLQKYGDRKDKDDDFPFLLMDETLSRYSRPIKDNIDYTRSIPDLRKQKSEVYDDGFFNDIKRLMNGYYAASGDAIEFRSMARGERRFAIPLHLASSSARGLSDLYFFLRHVAKKNHLLIIDEPESHLDTQNQRLLARLLARLVHAGLKVLLTTHSDYLVKELNNLIMLNASFANKSRTIKRLKYAKDDCIAPEKIRAYIATENSVMKCEIDKFGIDMPNFDETINEINDAANELASRLAAVGTD